jgi:hypothetical protein
MATPNYNYEKRQRELAKKKKKEEKLKERESRKTDGTEGSVHLGGGSDAEQAPGVNPPLGSQ